VFGQGRINDDMASNKRRRHTPDQIIRKLAEGNQLLGSGQELNEVCRHLQIVESTWRFRGGGCHSVLRTISYSPLFAAASRVSVPAAVI